MRSRIEILTLLIISINFLFYIGCSDSTSSNNPDIGELIDNIIQSEVSNDDPGIVVLTVFKGETTHSKGYGLANIEQKLPATPTTPYFIASISKEFTAMTTMICVEDSLFDYNDKINDFFPNFPDHWSGITIHHLLTHTSGLPDHK